VLVAVLTNYVLFRFVFVDVLGPTRTLNRTADSGWNKERHIPPNFVIIKLRNSLLYVGCASVLLQFRFGH